MKKKGLNAIMKKNTLKIGSLQLDTPFVLAPLAGITDKATRSLCSMHGASLVYTEMVSGKGLCYGDRKSKKLLEIGEDEGLVAYQLFGSDPEIMAKAVKDLANDDNPIVDLNVGCPVPKIVKNGEGSALLKKLDVLYDVVEAMVKNAEKPVTAKIRMGFERGTNTAVETAKVLESAGVAAVAVHGRTREQYYEGKADWQVIADVKNAINVPVIGNGDVMTGQDAIDMMDQTGCDGVMIGRAVQGNPWIFREILSQINDGIVLPRPTMEEMRDTIIRHAKLQLEYKGEYTAIREMRKHVSWYTTGLPNSAKFRKHVNEMETLEGLIDTVEKLFTVS